MTIFGSRRKSSGRFGWYSAELTKLRVEHAVLREQMAATADELRDLCGQARDHIAVLAAFRESYEQFVADPGPFTSLPEPPMDDEPNARHAVDTRTAAIPQVKPSSAAPCAY